MSAERAGAVRLDPELVLATFEELYRGSKPDARPVRRDARLADDLDIDSVLGFELLIGLEERFDVELVDDPTVYRARDVDQLVDLVLVAAERR
jgi:acyl carrier protein